MFQYTLLIMCGFVKVLIISLKVLFIHITIWPHVYVTTFKLVLKTGGIYINYDGYRTILLGSQH